MGSLGRVVGCLGMAWVRGESGTIVAHPVRGVAGMVVGWCSTEVVEH